MPQLIVEKRYTYLVLKRCFDICGSLVALILLSPLFLAISLLILFEDGAPVFYRHQRVGKDGKLFEMYKFRTMYQNGTKRLTPEQLRELHREFKLEDDPRVTRIGQKLRTSSLDELPQLVNILKGEMSFVGPRPIIEEEFNNYTPEETLEFQSVKPGLTGYWQAYARNDATYLSGERQAMEMYYVQNASVGLDLQILFKTVGAVIRKTGVK